MTEASAKEIGELLDLCERSVRRFARAGLFVRISHGRYDLELSIGNYARALRAAASGHALNFNQKILDVLAIERLIPPRYLSVKGPARNGDLKRT